MIALSTRTWCSFSTLTVPMLQCENNKLASVLTRRLSFYISFGLQTMTLNIPSRTTKLVVGTSTTKPYDSKVNTGRRYRFRKISSVGEIIINHLGGQW